MSQLLVWTLFGENASKRALYIHRDVQQSALVLYLREELKDLTIICVFTFISLS